MAGLTGEATFSTLCSVESSDYESKKYVIVSFHQGRWLVAMFDWRRASRRSSTAMKVRDELAGQS
jgi:hypothetical protein